MSTRGVLMFAHNNAEIDYVKIAYINALMVKKNLKTDNITLVTNEGTLSWAKESLGDVRLDNAFENIIVTDKDDEYTVNTRLYRDTYHTSKYLPFYNCDHFLAYELSPYDETLFIDVDYLIQSDALTKCWGSIHDVMINRNVQMVNLKHEEDFTYVDPFGIKMYWATVIYFKKGETAENMFSLVRHIYDNYSYYHSLYMLKGKMFRNDFAFSIAVHMLNGYNDNNIIAELPIPALYMCSDKDDIVEVNGVNDMTLLLEKAESSGLFFLNRNVNMDIHIMNKWAINRQADRLLELYDE